MTSHLPIQLGDGTTAVASRLFAIAGHNEVACEDAMLVGQFLANRGGPVTEAFAKAESV